MASKISINLDTSKENFLVNKCKQNDDLTLEAYIYENGAELNLTNKEIIIQALKSDNTYIIQNTDIVKENNKILAELDRDFSRVSGTTKIEIVLVESGKQNTTFSFYLEVSASVISGAVESSNTVTILENLQNKIVEAGAVKEETEQLISSGGAATTGDIANINAQLEHNMKLQNQENFLDTLKTYKCFKDKFSIVCNNTNPLSISIFYELLNEKLIGFSFFKQPNDDFLLLGSCRYGDKNYLYVDLSQENFDSRTGTWVTNASSEYYTKEVGATFTKTFTGYGMDFQCRTDNRGGVWEFVIDGDVENKVIVSTWNPTIVKKIFPIVRETIKKTHTVVATFKGQDTSQSYTEEARGWCYFKETTGTTTFIMKDYRPGILNPIILMPEVSNKEFAIFCKKQGATYDYQFIPFHNNVPSSRNKVEPKFYIDGVEKQNWAAGESYNNVSNFQIVQSIFGYNNGESSLNLMEINTTTSFDQYGIVNINGKTKALVDIDVNIGYGIMFPLATEYCNRIVTGIKNSYPTVKTDYSNTFLAEESDKVTSYISINNSSLGNLGVICNYNAPLSTLRQGMNGKPIDEGKRCRIEHRNASMQKMYQIVFQNHSMPTGEEFRFSGTFKVVDMQGLNTLI